MHKVQVSTTWCRYFGWDSNHAGKPAAAPWVLSNIAASNRTTIAFLMCIAVLIQLHVFIKMRRGGGLGRECGRVWGCGVGCGGGGSGHGNVLPRDGGLVGICERINSGWCGERAGGTGADCLVGVGMMRRRGGRVE